jgi:hypothetical protein
VDRPDEHDINTRGEAYLGVFFAEAGWDRRHPTKEVLRCRLCVREIQRHVPRTVVHEERSAPAHSVHRIHGASPSLLLQSRPWSRQEAGSLAKALKQSAQQRRIGTALHTDHCSTRKLDVDRAASSRHNHFSRSLLLFRVRHSHRNQRYARLAQFAALERTSPLEQLIRVHTLRSRHFGDASTRSQRKLNYRQLL